MKKALSLILSFCLIMTIGIVPAFAADKSDINLLVASDLHVSENTAAAADTDNPYEYSVSHSDPALSLESKAIFAGFLEKASLSDADYLFISGDIVNKGTIAEHLYTAEAFKAFEDKTGIKVLVINGNHDVYTTESDGVNASPADFKNIYASFGYSGAVAVDPDSCSYVYDLKSGYRLVAIDTCSYDSNSDGLTKERVSWVKAQLEQAKKDGKKVITMTHHAITEHFAYQKKVLPNHVINAYDSFPELLADNGVVYNFSGHVHINDIVKYTSVNMNSVYDVQTTSLYMYPAAYRNVKFSDSSVDFKTEYITDIDTSLVSSGANEASLKAMKENFVSYSYGCFEAGISSIVYKRLASPASIASKVGEEGSAEYEAAYSLIKKLSGIFYLPIYKTGEKTEGESFEALGEKYGFTVTGSDYKSYNELIAKFVAGFYEGDENYGANSVEMKVVKDCLKIGIAYALDGEDDMTAGVLASLIQRVTGKQIPSVITDYLAKNLNVTDYASLFIDAYLGLIVEEITVDCSVGDNNISLPSYKTSSPAYNKFANFLDRILEIIRKIFSILQNFFK